jgi:hypothetical protein
MGQGRTIRNSSLALLVALLLAIPAFWWLTRRSTEPPPPLTLQGELIETPVIDTNATTTAKKPAGPRRRPKPGSLPQRLVQFQYRALTSGVSGDLVAADLAPVNLPPDFILQTNDAALATSLVPDAQGYVNVGFDFLAGFDFELSTDLMEAAANPEVATEKVRAQIPEDVRQLDQKKVRMRGFLVPIRMDEGLAVEFLLMRDQTLCCYGTVPKVNEWVHVRALDHGVPAQMDIPLTVTGTLSVGDQRENGQFTGLYEMIADQCRFVR